MANIKSAMKRIKVTERKNLRNRMIMSSLKTAMKRVIKSAAEDDAAMVEATYRSAVSTIDKAAAKGVIHKNAASRKKAQLAAIVAAK